MLKRIQKRVIAFVLIVALTTGLIPVGNYNVRKADAFGVGAAVELFNVAIKTSTTVFNLTNDLAGMGKATTEQKFNHIIDGIFGNLYGCIYINESL